MPKKYENTLRRLLLLMGIYSLLRVLFLIWNWDYFNDESSWGIINSFLHGLRFDLSAICTINAPIILLTIFLPHRWTLNPIYRKAEYAYFFLINILFIGVNVADLEFYQFLGRRISLDVFSIGQDIQGQSFTLLSYYWYLTALYLLIAYLFWKFSIRPKAILKDTASRTKQVAWGMVLLIAAVLSVRGGLQLKPIMPVDAFIQESVDLGTLSLNSTFTLTRSENSQELSVPDYFSSNEQLLKALPYKLPPKPTGLLEGYNVVIIIMESFALEYVGAANDYPGYTPFLDQLAKEGHLFTEAFANGRRSVEAVPSILCSIPALMDQPLITSNFQSNRFTCLGEVAKEKGYKTAFFHGAQKGSMFFDSFTQRAGFDHYYGMNEYPKIEDRDGHWGIYDIPFFKFTAEEFSSYDKPFVATLFSLSSHHPYVIQKGFENRFPKGSLEIHESIGYADEALKQFFKTAKESPWFDRTLFVITGDHTSLTDQESYQDLLGRYRVPILFWTSSTRLPDVDTTQVVQHIDIFPTLTDLLGIEYPRSHRWGRALFNPDTQTKPMAFNKVSGGYWLLTEEGLTHATKELQKIEGEANQLPELQAILQYYFTGLIMNQWPED